MFYNRGDRDKDNELGLKVGRGIEMSTTVLPFAMLAPSLCILLTIRTLKKINTWNHKQLSSYPSNVDSVAPSEGDLAILGDAFADWIDAIELNVGSLDIILCKKEERRMTIKK